jgi:hypothetical protein
MGNSTYHSVDNKIEELTCSHIANASLINLQEINLCNINIDSAKNQVGDQGCLNLTKAHWPFLTTLGLGNI